MGMMHIVCYLRQESNVFETYWIAVRGVEAQSRVDELSDPLSYRCCLRVGWQ